MRVLRLIGIGVLAAVLGACATKVQARTEIELPPLDPPPPPPRVVAVYPDDTEPPVATAPVEEPVAPARPPVRPARPETRPEPARAEPARRPAPPSPSLTLTPAPGTETQTEEAIRSLMAQASRDLARVNAATLSTDARTQFDTARRFLLQAEDALKTRNVVFAGKLADKAATMAAGLVR